MGRVGKSSISILRSLYYYFTDSRPKPATCLPFLCIYVTKPDFPSISDHFDDKTVTVCLLPFLSSLVRLNGHWVVTVVGNKI